MWGLVNTSLVRSMSLLDASSGVVDRVRVVLMVHSLRFLCAAETPRVSTASPRLFVLAWRREVRDRERHAVSDRDGGRITCILQNDWKVSSPAAQR